jgi:hypothetical protein
MQGNDLAGKWRYRSFRNTLAPVGGNKDKALALIFAEAEFTFKISGTKLTGIIDWGSGGLDLEGTVSQAGAKAPLSVAIRGLGRPGTDTEGWEYDYNASLAHKWPNGIDQIPALVGTVIRVNAHGPGSPAGYVASFVALKEPAT